MELRKPEVCPQCGSPQLVEILYGRPTFEALEAAERGELVLGGCLIIPNQPDWVCQACGHRWFDAEDPARLARDQFYAELTGDDSDSAEG